MPKLKEKSAIALPLDQPVFTVSAFLDYVNELLNLENLSVQGEVTGWKIHPTGIYFSLKDKQDGALMDCYMSPYVYRGLGLNVDEGMEVRVNGIPSIYKARGRFSFRVETIELVGEGSLKKAYELLKAKLQAEGLFDRKRPLPEFIHRIGIITSKTGAVIDDFRKNIDKLGHELYLYDVRVEGAKAVNLILGAVQWFNKNMPELDVLVIMRGGGSLEDLQAFNHELVAREVFASRIPTICAIGHDRDVPIMSLVGDAATSTPTAAAMLVNKTWERLKLGIPQYERDLAYGFQGMLDEVRATLDLSSVVHAFESMLREQLQHVAAQGAYLESVNPERNLKLGYSIMKDAKGKVLTKASAVKKGDRITAQLAEGTIAAEIK